MVARVSHVGLFGFQNAFCREKRGEWRGSLDRGLEASGADVGVGREGLFLGLGAHVAALRVGERRGQCDLAWRERRAEECGALGVVALEHALAYAQKRAASKENTASPKQRLVGRAFERGRGESADVADSPAHPLHHDAVALVLVAYVEERKRHSRPHKVMF